MPALTGPRRKTPRRTVGSVPFGRLAIVTQMVFALAFVAYTLGKDDVSLPLLSSRYEIEVAFTDGAGLDEADEVPVSVAGADAGRVTDVRYEAGQAVATLELDGDTRGRIFADATAEARAVSGVGNLVLIINPGDPRAGDLDSGARIASTRTGASVAPDRVNAILDSDTRAYVQLLVGELERGIRGRASDVRPAVRELAALTDSSGRTAAALADRRRLLTRLVGHFEQIFAELGDRGDDLRTAIAAGSQTFTATVAREREVAETFRQLGPTLAEARRSFAALAALAEPLNPALEGFRPAARALPAALRALRDFVPSGRALFADVGALARDGREPVADLRGALDTLDGATTALEPPTRKLLPFLQPIDAHRPGIEQLATNFSGVISTMDDVSVRVRGVTVKSEAPSPENFGVPRSEARVGPDGYSELGVKVARALEIVCRELNTSACLTRILTDGLPPLQPAEALAAARARSER